MRGLLDGLRAVREMIGLGVVVIWVHARWHLWERWKKDAPTEGPFKNSDAF